MLVEGEEGGKGGGIKGRWEGRRGWRGREARSVSGCGGGWWWRLCGNEVRGGRRQTKERTPQPRDLVGVAVVARLGEMCKCKCNCKKAPAKKFISHKLRAKLAG
jgi:hypothetical protein